MVSHRLDKGWNVPPHIRVAATNWLSRLISMAIQLVTVPLLTRSMGYGDYAAYVVTISLMNWFVLADFGMGSALQNLVTKARIKGNDIRGVMAAGLWASVVIMILGGT